MKVIQLVLLLFFGGITVSYSKPYDVQHDYDQQVNFAELKTYGWLPVPEQAGIDSVVVQRVKNSVNAQLKAKGLAMTSHNPDFLIATHIGKKDKVQTTDWGYTYKTTDGYKGGQEATGIVSKYEYEEGSLILDFVDAKSNNMIWRGSAKAEVQNVKTAKKSEKVINKAVKAILKKFPPPAAK